MLKHKEPDYKAIFAITSRGNDFFSAMTRIAVASLRLSNPGLSIIVACDQDTDSAMKKALDPLIEEVDCWFNVKTPPGADGFRNRFLKTSLRDLIDGPFLFLDSDILVRGDLSDIFTVDTDIAAARNHSRASFSGQVWVEDAKTVKAMGWKTRSDVYVNGGVLYYNDTPAARHFRAVWHRRWLESFNRRGNFRDQPALNSALYDTKPRLVVLDDRFNAQIKTNSFVARNANVWHYYSSAGDAPHTRFELLVNELMQGAKLDKENIAGMLKSRHPWRSDNKIDDWAANAVIRRGRFDGWESAWLRREFKQHMLGRARKVLKRIFSSL